MTSPEDSFKEYLKKSERDLVIEQFGTDNSRKREDINLDMNRRLVEEIRDFNNNSSKQTNKMLTLTRWIMWLTVVMGILALIQVIILLK